VHHSECGDRGGRARTRSWSRQATAGANTHRHHLGGRYGRCRRVRDRRVRCLGRRLGRPFREGAQEEADAHDGDDNREDDHLRKRICGIAWSSSHRRSVTFTSDAAPQRLQPATIAPALRRTRCDTLRTTSVVCRLGAVRTSCNDVRGPSTNATLRCRLSAVIRQGSPDPASQSRLRQRHTPPIVACSFFPPG